MILFIVHIKNCNLSEVKKNIHYLTDMLTKTDSFLIKFWVSKLKLNTQNQI